MFLLQDFLLPHLLLGSEGAQLCPVFDFVRYLKTAGAVLGVKIR